MDSVSAGDQLLVVTDKGYGKRTELAQYPVQNRGGFGVKTLQLTDRTGGIVGARLVHEDHELMVSTKQGTMIRTQVEQISVIGRNTQGVRVIRLDDGDEVTAIARIEAEVEEDEDTDMEFDENGEPITNTETSVGAIGDITVIKEIGGLKPDEDDQNTVGEIADAEADDDTE